MHSYKSLVAWQRASNLCLATLEAVDQSWRANAAAVFDQLRRAAVSVDVNIVEGYALNTVPLFRHHLRIALASAAEAERLLEICAARGYLDSAATQRLKPLADATLSALFGLLRSPRLRQEPRRRPPPLTAHRSREGS